MFISLGMPSPARSHRFHTFLLANLTVLLPAAERRPAVGNLRDGAAALWHEPPAGGSLGGGAHLSCYTRSTVPIEVSGTTRTPAAVCLAPGGTAARCPSLKVTALQTSRRTTSQTANRSRAVGPVRALSSNTANICTAAALRRDVSGR